MNSISVYIVGADNKDEAFLLEAAIKFYYIKLFGLNGIPIGINVKLCEINQDEKLKITGYIHSPFNISDRKIFLICMETNRNIKQKLITLAHEMIHIHQIKEGHLNFYKWPLGISRWFWKGKTGFLRIGKYRNRPWEIDANFRQKELYNKFIEFSLGEIEND